MDWIIHDFVHYSVIALLRWHMYKTQHFVHMSSPPIRKNGRFWPSAPISLPWNNAKKQRFGHVADLRFAPGCSVFRPCSFPENASLTHVYVYVCVSTLIQNRLLELRSEFEFFPLYHPQLQHYQAFF